MAHPPQQCDFTCTQARPAKTGFKTGRRQHRSCDQCRKGKRACDVAFAKEPGGHADDITALGPCSNCKRTGKNCTLQWLRAVHRASLRPRPAFDEKPKQEPSSTSSQPARPALPQPAPAHQHDHRQSLRAGYAYPYSPPVTDDQILASFLPPPQSGLQQHPPDAWSAAAFDSLPASEALPLRTVGDQLDDDFRFEEVSTTDLQPDYASAIFAAAPGSTSSSGHSSNDLFAPGTAWDCDDDDSPENADQPVEDAMTETQTEIMPWRSNSYAPRPRSPSAASFSSFLEHLQPSNMQSRLASTMNQSVLTKGLWKVYHDSFENALSCWLTEKTCPYTYQLIPAGGNGCESLSEVWGPTWGNRIVQRVCHLDKSWSKLRGRPMSSSEDRTSSRALQLAIMAFATQWAQGSQRSTAEYSFSGGLDGSANPFPLDGEFDRMLQESFWHQARRALQDAADCESFRVVLAHIIFSFTQRPVNLDDHTDTFTAGSKSSSDPHDSSKLDDIIDAEGPPIFLETATRQVFAQRAKLHRLMGRNGSSPASKLDMVDRKTFDMMFWLCVMFDTLSAVMNDRPLVVSDKDSKISPDKTNSEDEMANNILNGAFTSTLPDENQSDLWGDLFLKPTLPLRYDQGIPRWPCTYEEAATTLCNAAPVKVLLYRKVARLQTLMSRVSTKREKMELAINDAVRVYQHWNQTYGRFFQDCMSDHDNLPARVQSWYVILSGHWHLAALSLADQIQRIDEGDMGLESQKKIRESTRLAVALKRENAFSVAELGRVSSPTLESSFAKSREYHFAVNKGALLTEPWTVVLIRSFAKAARVLLDSIPVPSQLPPGSIPINMNAANEYMKRCEYCIKALWYLGRKSDMAFLAATFLSNSLKGKAMKLAQQQQPPQPPQPSHQHASNGGKVNMQQPSRRSTTATTDSSASSNNFWNQWQGWENGRAGDMSATYAGL